MDVPKSGQQGSGLGCYWVAQPHPHSYLGLGQLPFEEVQGFSVTALTLLQPLELLLQLPLKKKKIKIGDLGKKGIPAGSFPAKTQLMGLQGLWERGVQGVECVRGHSWFLPALES